MIAWAAGEDFVCLEQKLEEKSKISGASGFLCLGILLDLGWQRGMGECKKGRGVVGKVEEDKWKEVKAKTYKTKLPIWWLCDCDCGMRNGNWLVVALATQNRRMNFRSFLVSTCHFKLGTYF
jgi:hypothetical protein